jgi:hypothetical protein
VDQRLVWEDAVERKARVELVLDCVNPRALAGFWQDALDYRLLFVSAPLAVLVPMEGDTPPLLLQCVPEPRAGKNRMHLDLIVEDIEPEVARLQALGARRIDTDAQSLSGTDWVRMADPEDNEFCVSTGLEWSRSGARSIDPRSA